MKRILLFVMSAVLMCSTFSCSKKSSSSSEKKDIDPIQRKVEGSIYYNELAGFKFDGGDTWIYADLNSDSWKKLEELGIDNDIENRDLNAHAEAGGLFTVDVEKYSGEPMDWVKNLQNPDKRGNMRLPMIIINRTGYSRCSCEIS